MQVALETIQKLIQILNMRKPTSIKELKSTLGMWTYFMLFVPGYSIIAAPLCNELKGDNIVLHWNQECEDAWGNDQEQTCKRSNNGQS